MKTFLLGTSALLISASSALATGPIVYQEPPTVVAIPAAAPWQGFYVGGSLGYGSANYDISGSYDKTFVPVFFSLNLPDLGGQGFLYGIQAGYNFQLSERFVLGVQLDAMGSGITNDTRLFATNGVDSIEATYDLTVDRMYTLAGRIGYLTSPNTMIYGLLGATRGEFGGDYAILINNAPVLSGGYDFSLSGVAIGIGMETMVSDNISLGIEYRYNSMERYSFYDGPVGGGDNLEIGFDTAVHTVRASVNFHF